MDKNAVFGYVEYAREELQKLVRQKAFEYGITEKGAEAALNGVIKGRVLSKAEVTERDDLISNIHANEDGKGFANGFDIVMEEAAYTWFNRFIALRFMEVNGYLPSHTRVFSDEVGKFNPQIIKEALTVDIYNIDRIKVADMVQNNRNDELFKYLIILQCNELSKPMPKMFEKISNYTELLFPNGLLKKGSIIDRLVSDIAEEDWKEQVQIIGWMYQFYISKKKDEVNSSQENISKSTIGAVTQLFTPDWIVRYMAENSIGRIWLESYPNSSIKSEMKYYVEDAEQEADVKAKLEEIRYKDVNPEDIKVIEPCCGSGHIMVYCFDLLYKMYIEKGYAPKDIATLILKNNIWGLDIDKRASQLAYFSVMMKARSVDRQFITRDTVQQPRVYEIVDSQPILQFDYEELLTTYKFTSKSISTAKYLVSTFKYAKVIGSLLIVNRYDYRDLIDEINQKMKDIVPDLINQESWGIVLPQLKKLSQLAMVLSRKYDVMITNPPYLGTSRLEQGPKDYFYSKYKFSKSDLCTMFMETGFIKENGCISIINMHSWMFIKTYENLRKQIISTNLIHSLLHLGKHSFDSIGGEVLQTCSFISRIRPISKFKTSFIDVTNPVGEKAKEEAFFKKPLKTTPIMNFNHTAGNAFSYWISDEMLECYSKTKIGENGTVMTGMTIGNNDKFLRLWFELNVNRISFNKRNISQVDFINSPWVPYSKGGARLNWYGGYDYVVNWSKNNEFNRPKTTMKEYYLQKAITWPFITGDNLTAKILPVGFLWDVAGSPCFFDEDKYYYILGLLCSCVSSKFIQAQNPTNNVQSNDISNIPLLFDETISHLVNDKVIENINIMKKCWDSVEESWDFKQHVLVDGNSDLSISYETYLSSANEDFSIVKNNEELINEVFINLYGLSNELSSHRNDRDITYIIKGKNASIVSLLSYLMGVSFGRYSLDHEGLCYAGGDWISSLYSTIIPDGNNIIPILDDGYYADDAMNKVVEFVTKVYGQDTLDENLKFIADALGGNGTSKEVIRNYLLSGFYSDHLKTYQKRPIYWLFDAGKQNSFKALIYMHRYTPDLLAKMRTDYILPLMDKYSSRIEFLEREIPTLTGVQATKSRKELEKVKAQLKEISEYEPKIHHLADERISIDLDDGVKHNYELFKDVLAPIK